VQGALPLHEQPSAPPSFTQSSPGLHPTPLHWHVPPSPQLPIACPTLHSASAPQPQIPGVAWPGLHSSCPQELAQLPHSSALDETELSQPSSGPVVGSVQLPKPGTHDESHTPPLQSTAATLVVAQGRAQAPQFRGSVARVASQPVATFWSQSPNPVAHFRLHDPALQLGVALTVLHAFLHEPQLPTSVATFTSQPFDGSPSQFAKEPMQLTSSHDPLVHDAWAWGSEHGVLQEPQLLKVERFVSHPFA